MARPYYSADAGLVRVRRTRQPTSPYSPPVSRVIASTLRPAAASGLVLLALGLSACGGDDAKSQASTPATSPAGTSPTGQNKATDASGYDAAPTPKAKKVAAPDTTGVPKVFKIKAAVTPEGSGAIAKASATTMAASKVDAQVKDLLSKLELAKFAVNVTKGNANTPTVIRTTDLVNVQVFSNDRAAAAQAASYLTILTQSKVSATRRALRQPPRAAARRQARQGLLGQAAGPVRDRAQDRRGLAAFAAKFAACELRCLLTNELESRTDRARAPPAWARGPHVRRALAR